MDVAVEFQGSGLRLAGCSDLLPGSIGIWDRPDSTLEDLKVEVLELQRTGYVLLAEDTTEPSFEVRIDFALNADNNVNHACSILPFGSTNEATMDRSLAALGEREQTWPTTWHWLPSGKTLVVSARVSRAIRRISCWVEASEIEPRR